MHDYEIDSVYYHDSELHWRLRILFDPIHHICHKRGSNASAPPSTPKKFRAMNLKDRG